MATIILPKPDTAFATPAVAALLEPYFRAKSEHDVARTMNHYARERMSHNDATLGWRWSSWSALHDLFAQYMPGWGEGVSYATQILGDENSAIVLVVDTPELFGGEVRAISAVDFRDGKIARFVDYWDGRHFGASVTEQMRVAADEFPATFGEDSLPEQAAPGMRDLARRLDGVLSAARAADAAELFAPDATLQDFALRVELRGRRAIGRYLERAVETLPYGPHARIRHVVGSRRGGGYEWINADGPVGRGIVALGVDDVGLISQFSVVYDGSLIDDEDLVRRASLALELSWPQEVRA